MERQRIMRLAGVTVVALAIAAFFVSNGPGAGAQGAPGRGGGASASDAMLVGVVDPHSLPPPAAASPQSRRFLHAGGDDRLTADKLLSAKLPPGAGILSPTLTQTTTAPSAGQGFDGISYADTTCGCMPPDGAIAAGPTYLVGAVNTAYEVWDKTGKSRLGPVDLGTFFLGCNIGFVTDPFTDYDAAANRFVLGVLSFDFFYDSSLCIAVSQSGDPTGNWNVYSIPVDRTTAGSGADLLDFPHMAISSDAIFVSGNQFGNFAQTYLGPRVYAFNKAQMYARQQQAAGGHYSISDTSKDTLIPARNVGVDKTMYFVSVDNNCPCSNANLWKWSDPWGSNVFTFEGSTPLMSYDEPPNATQPGGSAITTNDTRSLGAQWSNVSGSPTIYGAHAIACNPGKGTVSCVHWFQLGGLDSTPTLVTQGTVGADGQFRYFPNLAVNNAGELAIGFAFSSASDYAGVHTYDLGSGSELTIKAGEASIDGSRYGDYAGTVLDPDGCTVWHLEEYAKAGTTWGTWVTSLAYSDCSGGPTPTVTPTSTPTAGPSSTPTATPTPVATSTPTPVPATPTATPCPRGKQKNGRC